MFANGVRRGCFLAWLVAGWVSVGCGGGKDITRVTITVDASALPAATLASIRTIRLHVERDRQVIDSSFTVSPGALADGQYEVTYHPLSKSGSLLVVISALDAMRNVLATSSADVTIKTGQNATVTVSLGSTPETALLVVNPALVDFGDVVLGDPAGRMMVVVSNLGGAATGMLGATLTGDTASFVIDPTTSCDAEILMPGETCRLAIEFRPTEAGSRAGRLEVTAAPGGSGGTDLKGNGVQMGVVTIDPEAGDLGSVEVGRVGNPMKFTITNSGGQAASDVSLSMSGANADEMKVTNDMCSNRPLAAGANCTVDVAMAPTSAGPKTANLDVAGLLAAADGDLGATLGGATLAVTMGGSASARLTGIGLAAAALTIEPASQDLGTVVVGGGSSATFTVKNPGGLATGALSLMLSGPSAAEMTLATDGCTTTVLAAGASCSVTVNFSATSAGAKSAQLAVHASPGGDVTAMLTASVAMPGALTISPPGIDFGGILVSASSGPSAFTITNTGGTPSGPLALALGGGGAGQFMPGGTDTCTGQVLVAGGTCMVSYLFRPTTAGNKTASVVVMATPGGVGAASLIGRGLAPAQLAANATAALGTVDVGSSGTAFVWTIRNTGDVPTGALGTVTTAGLGDFILVNGCTGSLGPAATCAISVALSPKSAGDKTLTVTVSGMPGGSVALVATGVGRPAQMLSVVLAGTGAGTVTSDPLGITCGTTCGAGYRHGTIVVLTAAAALGSTFTGWSGACTGTGVCMVTLNGPQTVTATFTLNRYSLSVKNSGFGTVVSAPAGISCGTDCTEAYNHGTPVMLTATPDANYDFGGWGGACTGTGACMVTMTQAQTVSAVFTQGSFALLVSVSGLGRVTSAPAGIDCGTDCGEPYPAGTMVTLTASAATGQTFGAWGGACSATAPPNPCVVTMTQARDVSATFRPNPATLTVTTRGNGGVRSNPAGIDCSVNLRAPDCTETYLYGDRIVLTATPGTGSDIGSWTGGGCTGNGPTCTVTLTGDTAVNVDFVLQRFNLSVKIVGGGIPAAGVTSSDQTINCFNSATAVCGASYPYGTTVVLTAVPTTKTTFMGWDYPGCPTPAGAGPPLMCTVPMTMATGVVARFEVPVGVTTRVATGGTITSMPAGIVCPDASGGGAMCSHAFLSNSTVMLVAAPSNTRYRFGAWDGACAGQGATCTINLTSSVTAFATFVQTIIALPPVDPPVVGP